MEPEVDLVKYCLKLLFVANPWSLIPYSSAKTGKNLSGTLLYGS